eukprot:CAMPEP_0177182246 /NCGR_PEP_ID=MMETSP0367-20130122/16368_1 /TAXON_ID=447022 ORGANISM="Scrippsiella hangoei-like, Strain SHHI-4" /NCGR_SAMPLE_ID=MMETSP0367 /ASSEMBLY_ACC=CAM_ASM_000362 /LENGTH=360 /DNA_ID=CAMNT_0018629175 /DNA_START=50 /DNA_END=1132 /DNA_ORIENTATION=-
MQGGANAAHWPAAEHDDDEDAPIDMGVDVGVRADAVGTKLDALLEGMTLKDANMKRFIGKIVKMQRSAGIGNYNKYLAANFMFMIVLLGIEADMAGLFLSAGTYWGYDNIILRFFLFFFLGSFMFPLMIRTYVTWEPSEEKPQNERNDGRPGQNKNGSAHDKFMNKLNTEVRMPGVRFYLICKPSYDMTDVDAIFKVNSLSSFTLGIYQIMGIVFTYASGMPFNIYVYFNIVTQVLNWSITILYYATPISKWMGAAANARTICRHYQGIMNAYAVDLSRSTTTAFRTPGQERQASMDIRCAGIKVAITQIIMDKFFADCDPALTDEATSILSKMRDQDVKEFVTILRNEAMSSLDMKGGL